MGFLLRSLGQRWGRVAVAVASVMVASAVVVCGLGLSLGIRQKLGEELRAYGANAIVSPSKMQYLEQGVLDSLAKLDGVQQASGQLFASVTVGESSVELIGLEAADMQGWRMEGNMPGPGEVLLGSRLQEALGMMRGDEIVFAFRDRGHKAIVSGIVERGGPEDNALLLPLQNAQELTDLEGELSAILLRVDTADFQQTVNTIASRFPGLAVKTLRQVAYAEESFLTKIELLMTLVGLVVLAATSISVTSTMSATVLERMKEIGLMRAIGGTTREIQRFYLAEGGVIGIMGGFAGFAVGLLAAKAVSRGAFGSSVHVPFSLVFLSLALGVMISVLASLGPLRGAVRERPAVVLRGE